MKLQGILTDKKQVAKSLLLLLLMLAILLSLTLTTPISNAQIKSTTNKNVVVTSHNWGWKLLSHGMYQSKVGIYVDNNLVRYYLVECNLANQPNELESEESAKIEKIISNSNSGGLLLVTCIHGAHSKLVEIYDPMSAQTTPVFSQFGAYYAGWKKRGNQLFIYYDQACQAKSKNCRQFEKIEIIWPPNS